MSDEPPAQPPAVSRIWKKARNEGQRKREDEAAVCFSAAAEYVHRGQYEEAKRLANEAIKILNL